MEGVKSIQVMIAGRSYPLKVKVEDEVRIKNVVEEINEKIKHFQMTFSNKDKLDCITMTLLTYAVDYHNSIENIQGKPVQDKLASIDALLDRLLN